MSRFQGGMIGSVANATSGTAYTGRANGVFPLPQQIVAKSSSLWAIGQTRPNPPTIGTATGTGATTISVAFIPPVQNGGSAITSYTVTSSGGQTATGSSSPIVVSGLTTGTSYTFTVTATNALGTSNSSGTSNSVQPAITDPYFSSVSLLLNGDGTNGSTTFTDLSSSPKVITVGGNTQISTSAKKYGTGSIAFDGTGDYLSLPITSQLLLDGDFTIEMWTQLPLSAAASYYFLLGFSTPNNYIALNKVDAANYRLEYYDGNSDIYSTVTLPLNSFAHVAVVKRTGIITLYVNGYGSSATNTGSTTWGSNSTPMYVGKSLAYPGSWELSGYIDDLRITKGVARYTANFTPPTAAFPTL